MDVTTPIVQPSGLAAARNEGDSLLERASSSVVYVMERVLPDPLGESIANMLQPFFALPILAIAGIGMQRMMGYMVITFLWPLQLSACPGFAVANQLIGLQAVYAFGGQFSNNLSR